MADALVEEEPWAPVLHTCHLALGGRGEEVIFDYKVNSELAWAMKNCSYKKKYRARQ